LDPAVDRLGDGCLRAWWMQLQGSMRVGAENPVTSCDLYVFVDEAAEPVSS
jgi:hypothetical protein